MMKTVVDYKEKEFNKTSDVLNVGRAGAAAPVYYKQPPLEPPQAAPSRREKKIIEIIDPRTGVNVIGDLHESSSTEFKSSSANEVCTCLAFTV